jgi:two-component system chemotaxis response regulator CheB
MVVKRAIEATCPECRGPLSEMMRGEPGPREFRCLAGHGFSARALLAAHAETQERALWAAVVALGEARALVEQVADQFPEDTARALFANVKEKEAQAEQIKEIIYALHPYQF